MVGDATAAGTVAELEAEIAILRRLEALAERVRRSGTDRKWTELVGLLDDRPEMVDETGARRKLIVFTEHRDTLNQLVDRLRTWFGRPDAVEAIHGGVRREERRRVQETFTHDKDCVVLVATDAAGEGINLQRAHLVVNYDLPWNPNRIEQRFGRVHRIGQQHVCHLWNLVAEDTREGQVYLRLLGKLEEQRRALGGQVWDVLGRRPSRPGAAGAADRGHPLRREPGRPGPPRRGDRRHRGRGAHRAGQPDGPRRRRPRPGRRRTHPPGSPGGRGPPAPAPLRAGLVRRRLRAPRRAYARTGGRPLRGHPGARAGAAGRPGRRRQGAWSWPATSG